MAKAGRVLAGKYCLERLLGRGGMGSVWLARHQQLDCAVAVKLLENRRPDCPEVRARFEREARAVAQLRSPHVPQIHDQGVDAGVHYMVMELLEGEDLGARLRREGRLPLPEVARIVTQVARVLRVAHEAGIVHRDLKPSNLFLAREHDEETMKILDFGIAKNAFDQSSPELTTTGTMLGTLNYMSPEQLRDPRTADWRSDLWSLGVIAFYAATGREPFAGRAFGETVNKICKDPLPIASDAAIDLPRQLDAFFMRAFARERGERFQSSREMADVFLAIVEAEHDDCVPTQLFEGNTFTPPSSFPVPTRGGASNDTPSSSSARLMMRALPPAPLPNDLPAPSIRSDPPPASPRECMSTFAPWRVRIETPVPPSCAPMALPSREATTNSPSTRPLPPLPEAALVTQRPRGRGLLAVTTASALTVLAVAAAVHVGALGGLRIPTASASGGEPAAAGSDAPGLPAPTATPAPEPSEDASAPSASATGANDAGPQAPQATP